MPVNWIEFQSPDNCFLKSAIVFLWLELPKATPFYASVINSDISIEFSVLCADTTHSLIIPQSILQVNCSLQLSDISNRFLRNVTTSLHYEQPVITV